MMTSKSFSIARWIIMPFLLIASIVVFFGGRSNKTASKSNSQSGTSLQQIESKLSHLEAALIHKRITDLETRLDAINHEILNSLTPVRSAVLNVNTQAFDFVNTGQHMFYIAATHAERHFGGYKIRLAIGNPYNTKFKGFTINASWRPSIKADKDGYIANIEQVTKAQKTNQTVYSEILAPGTWTSVDLVIMPATPDELKNVSVRLITDNLTLSNRIQFPPSSTASTSVY